MIEKLKNIWNTLLFLVSLYLIYYGKKSVGMKNLGIMLLGLIGLVFCLYIYNKNKK